MDATSLISTFHSLSHGPDPRRASLLCRDCLENPDAYGSLHMQCCCDPCTHVRLMTAMENTEGSFDSTTFAPHSLSCCRCVPRAVYAIFTPTAGYSLDNCCREMSALLHFSHTEGCELDLDLLPLAYDDGRGLEASLSATYRTCCAVYTGTLGRVNLILRVGRFLDAYGYDDAGYCAWRITANTTEEDVEEVEVLMGDCHVECLSPPTDAELGPFEAIPDCEGYVTFAPFTKAKLAFESRASAIITTVAAREYAYGELDSYDQFEPTGFYGDCSEVCSWVCISGNFGTDNEWVFREALWFDDGYSKGWKFSEPGEVSISGTLYLESDGDTVTLTPDFSSAGAITVDADECGLNLYATQVNNGNGQWYDVHCGACSMWEFYCGSCRCVPTTICVKYWSDNAFYFAVLTWDDCEKAWINGDEEENPSVVSVSLTKGSDDECTLVPMIDGEEITLDGERAEALYDCQKESWLPHDEDGLKTFQRTHCMNPDIDHLVAEISGSLTEDGPYFLMHIYSGTYHCLPTGCGWACPQYRCSTPSSLTATLSGYQYVSGPYSPITEDFSIEFDLKLTYLARPNVQCWYVGVVEVECECAGGGTSRNVYRLEMSGTDATLYWTAYPRCRSEEKYVAPPVSFSLSETSCDPILFESSEVTASFGYCPNVDDFPTLNGSESFATLTVTE